MAIPPSYCTLSYKTNGSSCCQMSVVGGVTFASFSPCLSQFSRCRDFVFLCDCWKTLFLFGAFGLWYSWLFLVLRKVLIYKSTLICKTSHQPSISWCNVWHGISHYSHGLMHTMCSSQTLVGVSRIVFFASCWVPKKNKTNSELTCYCNLRKQKKTSMSMCLLPIVFLSLVGLSSHWTCVKWILLSSL